LHVFDQVHFARLSILPWYILGTSFWTAGTGFLTVGTSFMVNYPTPDKSDTRAKSIQTKNAWEVSALRENLHLLSPKQFSSEVLH
jgi:hypothetical protein